MLALLGVLANSDGLRPSHRGVMGHELEIHPLLAIFTLMVGGGCGRNRGDLSFSTSRRRFAGHLPKVRIASGRCEHLEQFFLTAWKQETRHP